MWKEFLGSNLIEELADEQIFKVPVSVLFSFCFSFLRISIYGCASHVLWQSKYRELGER